MIGSGTMPAKKNISFCIFLRGVRLYSYLIQENDPGTYPGQIYVRLQFRYQFYYIARLL